MPQYFFHLWDGAEYMRDDVGSELEGAEAAYLEAFETAQEMTVDLVRERRGVGAHRFDVTDVDGRLIHALPFAEIVGAARPPPIAGRAHTLAAEVAREIAAAQHNLAALREMLERR